MPTVRSSLIGVLELRVLRGFYCNTFISPCVTLLFSAVFALFRCRLLSDAEEIDHHETSKRQ
jgi:hypothetical protein